MKNKNILWSVVHELIKTEQKSLCNQYSMQMCSCILDRKSELPTIHKKKSNNLNNCSLIRFSFWLFIQIEFYINLFMLVVKKISTVQLVISCLEIDIKNSVSKFFRGAIFCRLNFLHNFHLCHLAQIYMQRTYDNLQNINMLWSVWSNNRHEVKKIKVVGSTLLAR